MKLVTLLKISFLFIIVERFVNSYLEKSKKKTFSKNHQISESKITSLINTEIFSSKKNNLFGFLLNSKNTNKQLESKPVISKQESKAFPLNQNNNNNNNNASKNQASIFISKEQNSNQKTKNKNNHFTKNKHSTKNKINQKIKKATTTSTYNSTTRKILKNKKFKLEKAFINRDLNKNFSLDSNQTSILKKADLIAKNRSIWDDSVLQSNENWFFPHKGISKANYQNLFDQATSNSNSRLSQPFYSILNRIQDLFDKNINQKMNLEVRRIRKMDIDKATEEIIRFGEKINASKNNNNDNVYWFYFYIVSEVVLKGRLVYDENQKVYVTRKWDISENSFNRFINLSSKKNNSNDNNNNNNENNKKNVKRILDKGIDKNYEDLLLKDHKYSETLEFYKLLAMNQILNTEIGSKIDLVANTNKTKNILKNNRTTDTTEKSSGSSHLIFLRKKNSKLYNEQMYFNDKVKAYNSSAELKLSDLRLDIFLLSKIKKSFLYRELKNFPKGVIHHLHWSAAFFMGDILAGVEKLIDENYQKKLITVIIKGVVFLKDKVRQDEFNEIPSPKLLIIEDFASFLVNFYSGKFKNDVKNFNENFILSDGRCIVEPMSKQLNSSFVDPNVKAYMIFKKCSKSKIYSKVLKLNEKLNITFLNKTNLLPFDKLSKYLQRKSHVLNTGKLLTQNYLSKTYENMLYTVKDRKSVAVWTKFETIFGIYSDLLENLNVFKYLNQMLLHELLEDKVIGVEFRQKYDIGKPNSLMELLKNMTYEKSVPSLNETKKRYKLATFPVSFILPGRKVRNDHKLRSLADALDKARSLNEEHTVGFDFFGYEDDPFSGARNFFPFTLRKLNDLPDGQIKITSIKEVFKSQSANAENKKETNQTNEFAFFLNMLRKGHKLYLHAGETSYFPNYPVDIKFLKKFYVNDNLIHSALLPNVERLGHGFAAGSNDLLMNIYRSKNISLEICPVSNQALKYHEVLKNPLTRLLREGISVTISPDDPGLFFYSGVTMDWFNLLMQTDLLPSEYYILLRNSILKSSIKEIKENAQKYLDEAKLHLEAFFNSENYRTMRQAFPDNEELRTYLRLGKHNGIKFSTEESDEIYWKKKTKNINKINNPFLDIYDINSIDEENKKIK